MNPDVKPKFHDVRKWGSSLAFFSNMSRELCDKIGWASVKVFKKHYLNELKALFFACVSIGRVIEPSSMG